MFQTVPLSIIRSFSVYTQQWYMSYRFADSLWAGSCSQAVSKPVWHIPLLCVQWKTPDDGQRNCPKHVEFFSKNKFEKLVHLVGFIIRIVKCICCYFYPDVAANHWVGENVVFKYGKETRGSTNTCVVLVIIPCLFCFIISKLIN